jgi:5-methylcytosine-specific restriction enzyme subunit McrC
MQGMVSLQPCTSKDCLERNYHRLNNDYYTLHQLCRFFLDNTIPSHEHGKNTSLPFLVNMAKLYEMFVAEWLRENLPPEDLKLKTQERIIIDKNIYFQTDLIIYDSQTLTPKYILDTKYKNPENMSKDDLAQVVAYAVSKHCPEAVLVYPTELNNSFNQYIGNIKVRSLTFSLDDNLEDGGKAFLKQLFD